MEQIDNTGFDLIRDLYYEQDVTGGDFADSLIKGLDKYFAEPINVNKVMTAIQNFRSWDAEEDTDTEFEVQCEVYMVEQENGIRYNSFQDYSYKDGTFVPEGTRIGTSYRGQLVIDEGIYYSDFGRE